MKHVAMDENAKMVETSDSAKLAMLSCKGTMYSRRLISGGKVTQNYATL